MTEPAHVNQAGDQTARNPLDNAVAQTTGRTAQLIQAMMVYEAGDAKRIAHFMKVYAYARNLGLLEPLDDKTQWTLEAAAIVHDIGIRVSEAKYGSGAGHYQELEGPPVAREMLSELGFEASVVDRVCWLVGHHHTYVNIDAIDYRILVEADFLVNFEEGNVSRQGQDKVRNDIFRTGAGLRFFDCLFPQDA